MASHIYTGLMLFALLHLGMAYSIWGPRSEQDATLDAMLDIFKSVENPGSSNTEEPSKLLASKLLTLYKQVSGIQSSTREIIGNEDNRAISEIVNILVHRKQDPKLDSAEQEFHKRSGLYLNDYLYFLDQKSTVREQKLFVRKVLEFDNDQQYKHSKSMSNLFELFASEVPTKLSAYYKKFPSMRALLNELLKYNERHEWESFMMVTTAYRLKSLEKNDDSYVNEFKRLRKQLMDKLALHEDKFYGALGIAESLRM